MEGLQLLWVYEEPVRLSSILPSEMRLRELLLQRLGLPTEYSLSLIHI